MLTKKGPWVVKGTKDVYVNPWIKVREDQVVRPDGKDGIFGVVTMLAGVSILPMDENGDVFLTREYHYAVERESIEVVSGGIEEGEDKLTAAKRELKEETGITATDWVDMGIIDPFTSIVNSPDNLFLATGLNFSNASPEGTESMKIIKVKFDEAVRMVKDGEITHSASVVLILKVKDRLNV